MRQREHDLVLHGATGFVGSLTAKHLAAHAGDARIALSGRSQVKLEKLQADLGVDWPILVTGASDSDELWTLAGSTTAVATTVGPYLRHGMPLVRACAQAGTAYADLTGETLFVRGSADHAHALARETGARITHSCGFDSVPSDLGTWLLHERVTADREGTMTDTALLVVTLKGGVSGGTVDSFRAQVVAAANDPTAKKILADPYALSPDPGAEPDGDHDSLAPVRDALLDQWVAPFVMGPFNSRVVRRSNALLDHAYGPGFRYREVMGVRGSALAAVGTSAATGLGMAAMALRPVRSLLDRVLPKPGEGPSQKQQEGGSFRVEIHTRTSTGARYVATVAAKGDPGYAATAVMLGQSGLSLALDPLTSAGGVLTPAVALGGALVERLRACGFELSVRRTA